MTTEENTWTRLKPLFRAAFPDADIEAIRPETTADDVFGWDSMAHVTLIVSIEEEFGIMFEPEEVTGFENVGELVALVGKKTNNV